MAKSKSKNQKAAQVLMGANTDGKQQTAETAAKPKSNTRVRLQNEAGLTLIFTKKMSKNGAIRVSATLSKKGEKPRKLGRETFTSHVEANTAMDKMVAKAKTEGWNLRERSKSGYTPPADKAIVIPKAAEATITSEPVEEDLVDETPSESESVSANA